MTSPDYAAVLGFFLQAHPSTPERIAAIHAALSGPDRRRWRRQLAFWVAGLLPVDRMVPEVYRAWRPIVRECMMFVVRRLSAARLAPKIVEQIELPPNTPPERRLIRLLARVPGLQKIGQILARNRRLSPGLRRALSQLENGISDVSLAEIREIIGRELGDRLAACQARVSDSILSEASVSAVVRFTWVNPASGRRERGVFKVRKPYIPHCYAEDMRILQQLANHLSRRRRRADEVNLAGISETLTEIRLLLEREVDFRREQATLAGVQNIYAGVPGVRVPMLIGALSTDSITALSEERGVKITAASPRDGGARLRVAERLAEALMAVPALSARPSEIYHADPHAGNLLYDRRLGQIVVLDWALTEQLTRAQRKSIFLLVVYMLLRDAGGVVAAILNLSDGARGRGRETLRMVRARVAEEFRNQPALPLPGAMAAMRLLESVALGGVRFPGALLMFRKASFTLDGVLADVAGQEVRIDRVVGRYAVQRWTATIGMLLSLLSPADWIALEWSLLTFPVRLAGQAMLRPWLFLPRGRQRDAISAAAAS